MLMYHGNARRHRFTGAVVGEFPAAKHNAAGVGRHHAEQHLHKGALSRAVLSQQANDFTGMDIEIDAVVGA